MHKDGLYAYGYLALGAIRFVFILGTLLTPHATGNVIEIQAPKPEKVVELPKEAPIYTLLFTGDIMLDRTVESRIKAAGDWRHPFLKIASTTREATLTIGNLEGPISDQGENQGSMYSFRMDPKAIEGLTYAGFDVLSLANNHIWDYGKAALLDTLAILKENDITPVGVDETLAAAEAPAKLTLEDGTTLAFFSYTNLYPAGLVATDESPGISWYEVANIKNRITNTEADIKVLLLHWGVEYEEVSELYQQNVARSFIDAGADLVIGHHPHVVQQTETHTRQDGTTGYIAYSLGNFVFDQDFSEETMRGLLVEATIQDKEVIAIEEIPVLLNNQFQPRLADEQE